MIEIILTAVDDSLADAWQRFCGDLTFVRVHRGSIFDVAADALVSPANSFGFMDGGIDMQYTQRFGWDLQRRLQQLIHTRHHGELLIGTAEIVETFNATHPFLIAAPTMRVPMVLRESVNAYLAARAVFLLIQDGAFVEPGKLCGARVADAVRSVAFPGLGTGVGQIGPNTCARQMRAAIDEAVSGRGTYPTTWADASLQHQLLYTDRPRNLQLG